LPAADADGINYTVTLTAETDTTGTFSMTEDYIQGDTIGQSFSSEGTYAVIENDGQKFVALTQDAANVTYFRCDGDSAITMVSADLTPALSDLNYTLTRTK
ncbi:MAG: copper resistance protein NlpE, partial [Muribaculaceae bacterium]|nr:copper resistance protein NlpE [Muribaculaceae bacterium]